LSAPVRREGFPRARRIRKRPHYLVVQNTGRRLGSAHYLLFARRQQSATDGLPRIGITVTKKVGNAVVRNRVKRWVRESCRKMMDRFPAGVDLVIVARPSAAGAGLLPTAQELASLARQLRSR
jgi:ribonuclease P protein component